MAEQRSILAKFTCISDRQIRSSHAMGRYLYLGTGPDGVVYRTLDGFGLSEFYKTGESYVTALIDFGNALFAGTSPGGKIMMHNFNTGNRFHYVTTGDYQVTAFAIHDDKLYAGTSPSGLIFSFNGVNWSLEYDCYGGGVKSMSSVNNNLYVFVDGVEFIPVLSSTGWELLQHNGSTFSIPSLSKVTTSIDTLQKNLNFDHSFSCSVVANNVLYFAPENRCNLYKYDGSVVTMVGQWDGNRITALEKVGDVQLLVAVDDRLYVSDLSEAG